MSQSTKDDLPRITTEEFQILRQIVRKTADFNRDADLTSATTAYQQVLVDNYINEDNDKEYFSALLRLHQTTGTTWAEKLVNVAEEIEADYKRRQAAVQAHHKRLSNQESWQYQRNIGARSVIQRKLDRTEQLTKEEDPFVGHDLIRPQIKQHEKPVALTTEQKKALALRFGKLQELQHEKILWNYWHDWRDHLAFVSTERREHWMHAIAHDNRTLKSQAFDVWRSTFSERIEQHAARTRKANSIMLKKFWRIWQNHIIQRREGEHRAKLANLMQRLLDDFVRKSCKRTMQRSLRTWRITLRTWDRARSQAVILRNKATQSTAWRVWFFRTCERKTEKVYSRKVMLTALRFWLARVHHVGIQNSQADALLADRRLISHWDVWRAAFVDKERLAYQAEVVDRESTLSQHLHSWRRATQLAHKHDIIQTAIDDRITIEYLQSWRSNCENRRDAAYTARMARLKFLFQMWNREARLDTFLRYSDEELTGRMFRKWFSSFDLRGREAKAHENQRRRVLQRWHCRARSLRSRLDAAEELAVMNRDDRHLSQRFKQWLTCAQKRRLHDSNARDTFVKTCRTRVFTRILETYKARRSLADLAYINERQVSVKKTFQTWFMSFVHQRQRVRADRLQQWRTVQDQKLLRTDLDRWRERLQIVKQDATTAQTIIKLKLFKAYFGIWSSRHFDQFDNRCRALDLEQKSLKRVYSVVCSTRILDRRRLANRADELWSRKEHKRGQQRLRAWQKCLEEYRYLEFQANNRIERSQIKLKKNAFKMWKTKFRALTLDGETTYAEEYSSESFDASRTRVDWTSETSVPSTPRPRTRGLWSD